MDKDILPKKFCCCIQLKHGVQGLCLYLIFIGSIQVLSLTGLYDLGYNTILTVGDILCAIFALLSIFSIRKFRIGLPLQILGVLWLTCAVINGVAWEEHIKGQEEIKQKILDVVQVNMKDVNAFQISPQIQDQGNQTYVQLNTLSTGFQVASQESSNDQRSQEIYDEWLKQIQDLDEDSLSLIFISWTVFKIYSSLCILKLGLKIERKHGKYFYYKLV